MRAYRAVVLAAVLLVAVAGCADAPAAGSASAGTSSSASAPASAAATLKPAPTPSPVATEEPTPTAEPTEEATASPSPESSAGETVYTVKAGDTLNAIAKRFKVTLEAILKANPDITNPNKISVGQKIIIPAP